MFKFFFSQAGLPRNSSGRFRSLPCRRLKLGTPLCLGLTAFVLGCRTLPLPPVDLQEPGWTIRQGEAVWRPKHGLPEIAGELLVARSQDRSFVQFTKNPFPMVIAQTQSNRWELSLPLEHKRFAHYGRPPRKVLWFQLPSLVLDNKPVEGWTLERLDAQRWRVVHAKSGQSLEGILNP